MAGSIPKSLVARPSARPALSDTYDPRELERHLTQIQDQAWNAIAKLAAQVQTQSGNNFPLSPSVGQLFFRTDLQALYEWNGSTWLPPIVTAAMLAAGAIVAGSSYGYIPERVGQGSIAGITSSGTTITWTGATATVGGTITFSPSTGKFTIGTTGLYAMGYNGLFTTESVAGDQAYAYIQNQAGTDLGGTFFTPIAVTTSNYGVAGTALYNLSAGDTVSIFAATLAGTVTWGGADANFWIVRIA